MVFEVLVDIRDIQLLEVLKEFFGVGAIYSTKTTATYRVARVTDLPIIIGHFTNYPLISKSVTFTLWAEAVELIRTSQHHVPATFNYILSIYAALGRGASKAVMQAYPTLTPITLPSVVMPVTKETIDPWWVSGYLTLYCSFGANIAMGHWPHGVTYKYQHKFLFSFDIVNLALAELLADFLGISCYIRQNEDRVDVMAQNTEEVESVMAFLDKYPLQSYKNEQYQAWRDYCSSLVYDRDTQAHLLKVDANSRYEKYTKLVNKLDSLQRK